MARLFNDEVVVRIWPNGHSAHKHPGHAAATIRSNDPNHPYNYYISWWPRNGGNPFKMVQANNHVSYRHDKLCEIKRQTQDRLEAGTIQPRIANGKATQYKKTFDYFARPPVTDVEDFETEVMLGELNAGLKTGNFYAGGAQAWVHRATFKTAIPGMGTEEFMHPAGARPRIWGLCLSRIVEWWYRWLHNPANGYRFISTRNNCASVVIQALRAGGAGAYVETDAIFAHTPHDAHAYAEDLATYLRDLNDDTNDFLDNAANNLTAQWNGRLADDMPSVRNWMDWSYLNWYSGRNDQVAAIDMALHQYHACGHWPHPASLTHQGRFENKLEALVTMMQMAINHRREKPNSDRRESTKFIGHQVVRVLRSAAFRDALAYPARPDGAWLDALRQRHLAP